MHSLRKRSYSISVSVVILDVIRFLVLCAIAFGVLIYLDILGRTAAMTESKAIRCPKCQFQHWVRVEGLISKRAEGYFQSQGDAYPCPDCLEPMDIDRLLAGDYDTHVPSQGCALTALIICMIGVSCVVGFLLRLEYDFH